MPQSSSRAIPARYSPPALRRFTQSQDPQPSLSAIEQQRYKERLHVRKDGNEQVDSRVALHDNFCLCNDDRKLAYHEAMNDIEDAAVGAARLADVLFMGIAVRPEWDTSTPLEPSSINVDFILTRQFQQNPKWLQVVSKIRSIVQRELAADHILAFHSKLEQLTPRRRPLDPETGRVLDNPVHLATTAPSIPPERSNAPPRPVPPRRTRNSISQPQPAVAPAPARTTTTAGRTRTAHSPARVTSTTGHISLASEPPVQSRHPSHAQECARRGSDDLAPALARLASDLGLSTPTSAPPVLNALAMRQERLGVRREDLPPTYEAEYYFRGDVDRLDVGHNVKEFLRSLNLTVHQCARVEASLDFVIADWIPSFITAGLEPRDARSLRNLVEAELPAEIRDIMRSVASDEVSDTSSTVSSVSSVSSWSSSAGSAGSSTTYHSC